MTDPKLLSRLTPLQTDDAIGPSSSHSGKRKEAHRRPKNKQDIKNQGDGHSNIPPDLTSSTSALPFPTTSSVSLVYIHDSFASAPTTRSTDLGIKCALGDISINQMEHGKSSNDKHRNVHPTSGHSRSSQALILGLAIPFAIVLFSLLVGLSVFLYRYTRRRNLKALNLRGYRQPINSDLEDKKGDFWVASNYKSVAGGSNSYSGKQLPFESESIARDGNERQMILDKLGDTSTQWRKTPPPEHQFRGQLMNTNFVLVPIRRPPSVVALPVPAPTPKPDDVATANTYRGPRHAHQPSSVASETGSTLSYVSYQDDAAYALAKAPGTNHSSMATLARPSPAATRLQMFRFPTRSSTSSHMSNNGDYAGLQDGEKRQLSKDSR